MVKVEGGLNGHVDTVHGGFTCTILDEVMGLVNDYYKPKCKIFTAFLNVTFKKPIPTPGILLIKTWIERVEERKRFTRGRIEDGEGNVYAEAEGLFIEVKASL